MIRGYLRSLKSIQRDLGQRPGTEGLSRAAQELYRFYDSLNRYGDVLVASEPPPKTKPAYKRGKPKRRNRRLKPTSSDWALAVLREAEGSLTSAQVAERIAAEGRPRPSRQGLSYVLRKLVEEGAVERIEVGGSSRCAWRAAD